MDSPQYRNVQSWCTSKSHWTENQSASANPAKRIAFDGEVWYDTKKLYIFRLSSARGGRRKDAYIYIEGVIHEKTSENAAFLPVTGADHQIDVPV